MDDFDDTELMLRYRDGDVRAFECLYRRHKTMLYRYLQRMCKQSGMADDVFQDVWSKVIAQRDRYEVRAQFKTYLFTIARNAALDLIRRNSAARIDDWSDIEDHANQLADGSQSLDTQVATLQLRHDVKQELEKLPGAQREAFVLFEEAEMDLHQIAVITGVSMETAKSRLRYAVSKLRSALQQYHPAQSQLSSGAMP